MGFAESDLSRDVCMLTGGFARRGYDWWRHSFVGRSRRTGEEKAFFVEFFLCNPAGGGKRVVLGQQPENQRAGRRPSYLMVKAGAWGEDAAQLHRFFPWKDVRRKDTVPFFLTAADCYLSETQTWGHVSVDREEAEAHPEYMCQAGEMSWELHMEKQIPFNAGCGAGRLSRMLQVFERYWHGEGVKTRYSGTVRWNGEEYRVLPEGSYGYADKNWGSGLAAPWLCLTSSRMKSVLTGKVLENSAFVIGGGCQSVCGILLKHRLWGAFCCEGQAYEFNPSKWWTFTRTKFDCRETEEELIWRVRMENTRAILHAQVHCRKKEMLMMNYETPDGGRRPRQIWSGGTGRGRVRLYKKEGIYRTMVDDLMVRSAWCGEMEEE